MPGHDDDWTYVTFTPDRATAPAAPETTSARPRKHRRRWPLVATVTACALAMSGGALAYGDAVKTVELDVDGDVRTVRTTAGSVDGLLESQGVTVGDKDAVTPSPDTALTEDSDVVVRSAKELTLDVDGKQKDTWVTALDADEALDTFSARGDDVEIVASRDGDRASLPVDLDTDGSVAVIADGKAQAVAGAAEADEALAEAGVELDDDDLVHVADTSTTDVQSDLKDAAKAADKQAAAAKKSGDDAKVEKAAATTASTDEAANADVALVVERVETKKVTDKTAVEHKTTTKKSDDRYSDLDAKVTQKGKDGVRTTIYQVTTVDGEVTKKKKVSDEVTTKPTTEVKVKGTKERPEPEPAEPTTPTYSGSTKSIGKQMAAARGWTGSEWTCLESLWDRESGWSATAANPSSGAYGIPQSLPGSKMASAGSDWQTNPATQIEWGLDYIASVYGSPCGAWAHSESTGWY